ncbi:MAG: hypothetical protein ACRD9Q_02695, partial [Nitrososphaeraceae archaeon]
MVILAFSLITIILFSSISFIHPSFAVPVSTNTPFCGLPEDSTVKHAILNGTIKKICFGGSDDNKTSLVTLIDAISNGTVSLEIPRDVLGVIAMCEDTKLSVMFENEMIQYEETKTSYSSTLIIPFQEGIHEIKIFGDREPNTPIHPCKEKTASSGTTFSETDESEWKDYWVKGKFYTADRKLVFQVFKISYKITGGDVNSIDYYDKSANIHVKIKSTSDGIFQINVPRNLPMTNIGREDTPFIVVDGNEAKYNEVKSDCYRTFSIPFQKDTSAIELIGAMNLGSDPVRSIEVPVECIIKPSPKTQIENGVLAEDIACKEGLELIFKSRDGSPACVKPQTADKLVERGWGTKSFEPMQEPVVSTQKTWVEIVAHRQCYADPWV